MTRILRGKAAEKKEASPLRHQFNQVRYRGFGISFKS
tara:strand:+ start:282 stop:392 length:111 start_codon:yes stop_codon:yes gene_type:complete